MPMPLKYLNDSIQYPTEPPRGTMDWFNWWMERKQLENEDLVGAPEAAREREISRQLQRVRNAAGTDAEMWKQLPGTPVDPGRVDRISQEATAAGVPGTALSQAKADPGYAFGDILMGGQGRYDEAVARGQAQHKDPGYYDRLARNEQLAGLGFDPSGRPTDAAIDAYAAKQQGLGDLMLGSGMGPDDSRWAMLGNPTYGAPPMMASGDYGAGMSSAQGGGGEAPAPAKKIAVKPSPKIPVRRPSPLLKAGLPEPVGETRQERAVRIARGPEAPRRKARPGDPVISDPSQAGMGTIPMNPAMQQQPGGFSPFERPAPWMSPDVYEAMTRSWLQQQMMGADIARQAAEIEANQPYRDAQIAQMTAQTEELNRNASITPQQQLMMGMMRQQQGPVNQFELQKTIDLWNSLGAGAGDATIPVNKGQTIPMMGVGESQQQFGSAVSNPTIQGLGITGTLDAPPKASAIETSILASGSRMNPSDEAALRNLLVTMKASGQPLTPNLEMYLNGGSLSELLIRLNEPNVRAEKMRNVFTPEGASEWYKMSPNSVPPFGL